MIVPKRAKILLQNAAKFYESLYFLFLGGGGGGGGGGQEVEKSVKEKTSEEWGENNFFALAFCLACPF